MITSIMVVYSEEIMRFIKTSDEIVNEACGYIRIIFAGIPCTSNKIAKINAHLV